METLPIIKFNNFLADMITKIRSYDSPLSGVEAMKCNMKISASEYLSCNEMLLIVTFYTIRDRYD
jgi:hypothetical protein